MSFIDHAHEVLSPLYQELKADFPDVPLDGIVGIISVENSGMNPQVSRFEKWVYLSALAVKNKGISKSFPGFNSGRLKQYIKNCSIDLIQTTNPPETAGLYEKGLVILCSSWGLGQMMGFHYIEKFGLAEDEIPALSLKDSLFYMMAFYKIEMKYAKTYEQLLRKWNTGSIHGKTHNRNYVPNAVKMAKAYEAKYGNGLNLAPLPAAPIKPQESLNARIKAQLDIIDAANKEIRRLLG